MGAAMSGRSGRHISIGVKIFTVGFVVFALMSSVTLLTVYMAATVSRELDALGHRYIDAYVALARTHIWSLERSLVDPTSQMWPINRPVRIVTRDGKVINGRRLNEDTYTVQMMDDKGHLVSLAKADLREFTILVESPMPPYRRKLTSEEVADLVAYLLSLKGS